MGEKEHSHWILMLLTDTYYCSECGGSVCIGKAYDEKPPVECPFCHADMRKSDTIRQWNNRIY